MKSMRTLTITVTDKQYKFLEEQIREGKYATKSEVVRDAINKLMEGSE